MSSHCQKSTDTRRIIVLWNRGYYIDEFTKRFMETNFYVKIPEYLSEIYFWKIAENIVLEL